MKAHPDSAKIRSNILQNAETEWVKSRYYRQGSIEVFMGLSSLLEEHFFFMRDVYRDFFDTADVI